jgi:hypothetical protein
MSSSAASSTCAAIFLALAMILSAAVVAAVPPSTTVHEAPVPPPSGARSVSERHADVGLVEPKPVAEQDLVHHLVALAVRYRARDHRDRAAGIEPHHHRLALRLRVAHGASH